MKERRTGFTLNRAPGRHRHHRLLAAILFPVFARARESARKTSCLNNVKQMGTALMMYVDDNKGRSLPALPRLDPAQVWADRSGRIC